MSFVIRKAVINDAENAAQIVCSSWKAAYKDIITPEAMKEKTDIQKRTELFQRIISEGEQSFYIVLDNEKPCGFCTFDKTRDEDLPDFCEIIAIYFLPEYWGKGYGKKTMEFVINEITKLGYSKISLWTLENNIRARKFYESCSFKFDSTKKECSLGENLFYVRYILI